MKRTHRNKEVSELQTAREENRALKKENNSLRSQVKRLQKREHLVDDQEKLQLEAVYYEEKKTRCPECAKGYLESLNIVGRMFSRCTVCDYRTRTIKVATKRTAKRK